MQIGDFKALFSALLLPPAGPLLLALFGLLLARGARRLGWVLAGLGLALLWLLSCHAIALELARTLVPPPPPVGLAELARAKVQAVVVVGGGVQVQAPEYGGDPQPSAATLGRLRYGARLARATGLPLAFSGGKGWSGRALASEAQAARLALRQDFGTELRWSDDQARDTRENAQRLAALMQPAGVRRIALVSDAWHLPRAALEFRRAGFEVLPAPTGLPAPHERDALEWLPSAYGLSASRQVLREWLALQAIYLSIP